jgi:hypothetical protein
MAIEAGEFLKSWHPHAEITVRDLDGIEPPIVIKAQPPQVKR